MRLLHLPDWLSQVEESLQQDVRQQQRVIRPLLHPPGRRRDFGGAAATRRGRYAQTNFGPCCASVFDLGGW